MKKDMTELLINSVFEGIDISNSVREEEESERLVLATSNLSLVPRTLGKDDQEMEKASPKEENSQELEWEKSISSKRKRDSHHRRSQARNRRVVSCSLGGRLCCFWYRCLGDTQDFKKYFILTFVTFLFSIYNYCML